MDFTMTEVKGYYDANLKPAKDILSLSFICPECGDHYLEETCTYSIPFRTIVSPFEHRRTGHRYWEHDSFDFDQNDLSFRCLKCGYEILDESGSPIWNTDELAEWLMKNCDQIGEESLKDGRWTENAVHVSNVRVILCKAGFERIFDDEEQNWVFERWEHPDGEYRLLAFHGKGMFIADSVNHEGWMGVIEAVFGGLNPDWTYMEDVLELVVYDSDLNFFFRETLQPGKAPLTEMEWQNLVNSWLSDPSKAKEPGTTLALLDRRTDKNVFTHCF